MSPVFRNPHRRRSACKSTSARHARASLEGSGETMRSDPLDVATAITIGRGSVRKMRQNLGWAIG